MRASFLMCRPDYYGIDYVINPWMKIAIQPDPEKARVQWDKLVAILEDKLKCDSDIVHFHP